jgi:hypothetical protein
MDLCFPPNRADPAFHDAIGLGRMPGRQDNLYAFGPEHGIKSLGKLPATVMYQVA